MPAEQDIAFACVCVCCVCACVCICIYILSEQRLGERGRPACVIFTFSAVGHASLRQALIRRQVCFLFEAGWKRMFVCAGVHSIPMFLLALNSVSTYFLSNGSGSVAGKYVCVESISAVAGD